MMKNSLQSWLKRWKTHHDMNIETRIWSCTHGCLCESILFTGCFYSGRLAFPVSIPHDRTRDGMKERKKERGAERGRDKNTEKERARWDKLITSGLVFLSYASDSTEVFCLADSVFGWDVFMWARIHTGEVIFLNGWATITLTRWTVCGYFFFPLITAYCRQHDNQNDGNSVLCKIIAIISVVSMYLFCKG